MSMTPYSDDETSKDAAESVKPIVRGQALQILEYLVSKGTVGATQEELETALSISGNSLRPRLKWMEEQGFVYRSGLTRPTRSKRQAKVWLANTKGLKNFFNHFKSKREIA